MSLAARIVCWLSFALVLAAPARAQDGIKFFHPEKFERATTTDDKGLTQWAAHAELKCVNCSGTGKAKCTTCERFDEDSTNCPECKRKEDREVPCRACAGTGTMPDPLEQALCAGCRGASFLLCTVCSGGGRLRIDKAKQWSACPACRGAGGYKCTGCNGTRLCEVAALKPSLKDANLQALQKALAATDQAMTGLLAITPAGGDKARKEVKAIVKLMEGAQSVHPILKRVIKAFEDLMGKTYAGANFQGHEENEAEAMNLVKGNVDYYLKHQKRMLELAIKRAEANAAVEAANKGK